MGRVVFPRTRADLPPHCLLWVAVATLDRPPKRPPATSRSKAGIPWIRCTTPIWLQLVMAVALSTRYPFLQIAPRVYVEALTNESVGPVDAAADAGGDHEDGACGQDVAPVSNSSPWRASSSTDPPAECGDGVARGGRVPKSVSRSECWQRAA